MSFWITLACSKEREHHIFRQYWYTRNVPVFTDTGTFQYLGPEVYFFRVLLLYIVFPAILTLLSFKFINLTIQFRPVEKKY